MRTVDAAGLKIGDGYPPRIMGVLNVSQESPYKPSVFNSAEEAAAYVDEQLIDQGADIVDIGLESANKRFEVLSAAEELDRLDTALETIESVSGDAIYSIETRYHEVAERALDNGFDMVNDICGFADPKMPEVCAEYDVAVGKMASPPDLERPGAIESVDEIYDALFQNGITEKTLIDPAFGGWSEDKTLAADRETFDRLREFRAIGQPMLVSINRKNFLRDVAGRDTEQALPVSLAATAMAVERGAHVIRTHDVAETRDAALIGKEFTRERATVDSSDGQVSVEALDVTTLSEGKRHIDRLGDSTADIEWAVSRLYELRGLSESERAELSDRVAGEPITVAVDDATGTVLLGGPIAAVDRLSEQVTGPLAEVLEAAMELERR